MRPTNGSRSSQGFRKITVINVRNRANLNVGRSTGGGLKPHAAGIVDNDVALMASQANMQFAIE